MVKRGSLFIFHNGDEVRICNETKGDHEGLYTFKGTEILSPMHLMYIENDYYEINDIDDTVDPVEIKIENLKYRPGMFEINEGDLK